MTGLRRSSLPTQARAASTVPLSVSLARPTVLPGSSSIINHHLAINDLLTFHPSDIHSDANKSTTQELGDKASRVKDTHTDSNKSVGDKIKDAIPGMHSDKH